MTVQHFVWWQWILFFFASSSVFDMVARIGLKDRLRDYRAGTCALLVTLVIYFASTP